jgi:hypothetical protein
MDAFKKISIKTALGKQTLHILSVFMLGIKTLGPAAVDEAIKSLTAYRETLNKKS